ncbi:MAG: tetratricopeptide repeat protein [Rickettsiaceae bacterium]
MNISTRINQFILLATILLLCSCKESKPNYSCDDIEKLEKLSDNEDAAATTFLGLCYAQGNNVAQDYNKAKSYYQQAADQGDASAQYNLGNMYRNGQGVEQDYAKAKSYYLQAAEQNHASAQYNLGVMYDQGQGVEQDDAKALFYYQQAAEQNHANAQYNLGVMYDQGQGIEQDDAKALFYYQQAAEQNHASAQYNLGNMYAQGSGVEQDYAKALFYYQQAADQGDASAQNNLGLMYKYGIGVKQDLFKAAALIQKAADQGNVTAQQNIKDKSLQIAKPFGLKIGDISLEQVQALYNLSKIGQNKWTNQPMYSVEPISQIDFHGIQKVILVFDENNILQAITATFNKSKFNDLLVGLEEKYINVYKEIPYVGNKLVCFETLNSMIELQSLHLSYTTELEFYTKKLEALRNNKFKKEKAQKSLKEKSML